MSEQNQGQDLNQVLGAVASELQTLRQQTAQQQAAITRLAQEREAQARAALLAGASLHTAAAPVRDTPPPKLVLVMVIDGLPAEQLQRYRGQFDAGWDAWREQVYARQLASGIIAPSTVLSERPQWVRAWSGLSADERRLYARQMEVFAGFMEQTDYHLGRLIADLERRGELDNTLILLASDNGASAEGGEHGSFNECQFPNRVEPTVADNLKHLAEWGSVKSFANYAWGWAWAGNTPLRRWKRYLHQGGMSDPLIVHWPQGIQSRGEVRSQYAHVVDITPTILEALGLDTPPVLNHVPQRPLEGVSFAHTFHDAKDRKSTRLNSSHRT